MNTKLRKRYLPIKPCDPHMDHGILLHFNGENKLLKKSYVNSNEIHRVLLKHLIRYPHDRRKPICIFSDDSLQTMIEMSRFEQSDLVRLNAPASLDERRTSVLPTDPQRTPRIAEAQRPTAIDLILSHPISIATTYQPSYEYSDPRRTAVSGHHSDMTLRSSSHIYQPVRTPPTQASPAIKIYQPPQISQVRSVRNYGTLPLSPQSRRTASLPMYHHQHSSNVTGWGSGYRVSGPPGSTRISSLWRFTSHLFFISILVAICYGLYRFAG